MEYKPIKDGATVYSGFAFKRNDLSSTGDYPIIKIGNLVGSTVDYSKTDFISKSLISDKHNKYFLNNKDVLIAMTGQGSVGRVAQLRKKEHDKLLLNQRVGKFVCNKALDNDYLFYVLSSSFYQEVLFNLGYGSGQPNLSPETILNVSIPFPSLEVQKKIANILSAIGDKIAINTAINENLESQAQAIFKSWFVDFEPFGGVMPENWKITTLGEISEMSAGGDKPRNATEIPTTENTVPIYSNGISNEGLYGFTDKAKVVEESVTVSARGTIGYVCLRQTPYVPIVRLITIVPKTSIISAKYIYLQLKTMNISGTGTTQQQLTVPNFKSTELLMPNIATVNKFTSIVNPMFEKIKDNKIENQQLASLRDTLLPKLMNGEIDVSAVKI